MEYDEDGVGDLFNSFIFGLAGHCMVNSGKRRVPSLVVCTGPLGFEDDGAGIGDDGVNGNYNDDDDGGGGGDDKCKEVSL